jgi:hypothetical protein
VPCGAYAFAQARFANDQDRLQRETAKLYQEAGVNPLAGCLPTLATLPVRPPPVGRPGVRERRAARHVLCG